MDWGIGRIAMRLFFKLHEFPLCRLHANRFVRAVSLSNWLIVLTVGLWALTASGQTQNKPGVSFLYNIEESASRSPDGLCPSELDVRSAVEARIGYAPWDDTANRRIRVDVAYANSTHVVQITIMDRSGKSIGKRKVVSKDSCQEAMAAASLTIAIAIAPTVALKSSATVYPDNHSQRVASGGDTGTESSSSTPTTPAGKDYDTSTVTPGGAAQKGADQVTTVSTPEIAAENSDTEYSGTNEADGNKTAGNQTRSLVGYFGGLGTWGTLPGGAGGVDLGLGFRWSITRVYWGLRYDIPREMNLSDGRIMTRELLGQAAFCMGKDWGFGCAGISVGGFRAEGNDLELSEKAAGPAAFSFARLGAEFSVGSRFFLQVHAELAVPLIRQKILERNSEKLFWQTPPLGGAAGATLIFTFF